jgi:hypothetical protein
MVVIKEIYFIEFKKIFKLILEFKLNWKNIF